MPTVPLVILFGVIFAWKTVPPLLRRRPPWPALALLAVATAACWWPIPGMGGSDAFGHFHAGNALLAQGRTAEARAAFTRALAAQPGYPQGHLNIGFTWFREGNLAAAETAFREELRLHPDSEKAMHNLGVICREQGKTEEAIRWLRQALAAKPWFPEARRLLASLLDRRGSAEAARGRLPAALQFFAEAVELDDSRPAYRYNYALALGQNGREAEALAQLRRVLEIDPGFEPARQMLAARGGANR
jgi:tetratricopeptide (TPR) repeat protein